MILLGDYMIVLIIVILVIYNTLKYPSSDGLSDIEKFDLFNRINKK